MSSQEKDTKTIMEQFAKEYIEVENNTDKAILITACRSTTTGKLYIHLGKAHGTEEKIDRKTVENIRINEVLY